MRQQRVPFLSAHVSHAHHILLAFLEREGGVQSLLERVPARPMSATVDVMGRVEFAVGLGRRKSPSMGGHAAGGVEGLQDGCSSGV